MGAPINVGAPGIAFYTPFQDPPVGSALTDDKTSLPKLFQPIKLRNVELQNRIWVSPMCQYSAEDGFLTPYHLVHLGQFALRGSAMIIVEASAVVPEGRISPEDAGIWKDEHIPMLKQIGEFVHSQGQKYTIQLAHAGRKASTTAPFLGYVVADKKAHGWPDHVLGPSAEAWDDKHAQPKEMTKAQIKEVVDAFQAAAVRSVKAGVDVINVHMAHGYLLHEFASPVSNHRTDEYGGSFENRIRLHVEIIEAIKEVIPKDMPIVVRISATDWLPDEESWDVKQSIELARRLKTHGVDMIEVSSAGNSSKQQIKAGPGFQAPFAEEMRSAVPEMLFASVGLITEAQQAEKIAETQADVVLIAREFLRNPNLVLDWARELGVDVQWPKQYHRAKHAHGR